MLHWLRKIREWITPGVACLLGLLTASYVAAIIGRETRTFDLYAWLALDAGQFWHGRVWTMVTYFLLPAGFSDFVLNGFFLAWIGGLLERAWHVWKRTELWLYGLLAVAGTGFAKALLTPSSPWLLVGTSGLVFGLLAALWRLCGHERVIFLGFGEMSMKTALMLIAGVNVLVSLPCAGLVNTLIALSGGIVGWLYLTIRFRSIHGQRGRTVADERISRLEM